jgi:hypothetical protein
MQNQVNTKRGKLLDIIQALTQKTVGNGCTEAEAIAAAEKAQRFMEKHGLTLADLEAVDPVSECEQLETELGTRLHPVSGVANAIADFTDTSSWYIGAALGYRLVFFGLPGDVRIATYLARVIRDAMDLEWRFWWVVNCGLTPVRPNTARKNFIKGMADRIANRLFSLKRESKGRNNNCKAIVLRKKDIIEEAMKALKIKIYAARGPYFSSYDGASYAAGDAAGMHVSLNAGS